MSLFRDLTADEIIDFRQHARDTFDPAYDRIQYQIWHPVVVDECRQIMAEHWGKYKPAGWAESRMRQNLVNQVIDRIESDINDGDYNAIAELVEFLPVDKLSGFLSDYPAAAFNVGRLDQSEPVNLESAKIAAVHTP